MSTTTKKPSPPTAAAATAESLHLQQSKDIILQALNRTVSNDRTPAHTNSYAAPKAQQKQPGAHLAIHGPPPMVCPYPAVAYFPPPVVADPAHLYQLPLNNQSYPPTYLLQQSHHQQQQHQAFAAAQVSAAMQLQYEQDYANAFSLCYGFDLAAAGPVSSVSLPNSALLTQSDVSAPVYSNIRPIGNASMSSSSTYLAKQQPTQTVPQISTALESYNTRTTPELTPLGSPTFALRLGNEELSLSPQPLNLQASATDRKSSLEQKSTVNVTNEATPPPSVPRKRKLNTYKPRDDVSQTKNCLGAVELKNPQKIASDGSTTNEESNLEDGSAPAKRQKKNPTEQQSDRSLIDSQPTQQANEENQQPNEPVKETPTISTPELNFPASIPTVEVQDGVEYITFVYKYKGNPTQYRIRTDIETTPLTSIPQDFRLANAIYPSACCADQSTYTGVRWEYENSANILGWKLAWINQDILCEKKGLLQRAVDAFRNRFPELRSRKVLRQERRLNRTFQVKRRNEQACEKRAEAATAAACQLVDLPRLGDSNVLLKEDPQFKPNNASTSLPPNSLFALHLSTRPAAPKRITVDLPSDQKIFNARINLFFPSSTTTANRPQSHALYPRATLPFETYIQKFPKALSFDLEKLKKRYEKEAFLNEIGFAMLDANPRLVGRQMVLQKVVDGYRERFLGESNDREGMFFGMPRLVQRARRMEHMQCNDVRLN
ncbi:hypothetical protein HDV05_001734 [Chytridiales sp. JEL 0842]|nr:hypothetical protein HDV05_001734 [Chytridiales sp. JEL 0842]